MFELYMFAWKRFGTKSKIYFILTATTAFVCNIATVLTPILQKKLIEQISLLQMETAQMVSFCMISIMGIVAVIAESLLVNSLVLSLKRKLQEQLLEAAVRNQNTIIASKGAGAYMVSIFGDSEQIANLLQLNVFNLFFHMIAVAAVFLISAKWSLLFLEIIIPSYIVMIVIHLLSNQCYMKFFQMGREKVYEVNPIVLEYVENRMSIRGYANMEEVQGDIFRLFDTRDGFFKKAYSINALSASVSSGVCTAAMMLFFIFSLLQLSEGRMQVSSFVALLSYFAFVFSPVSMIKEFYMNRNKFKMLKQKIAGGLIAEEHLEMPENARLSLKHCTFSFDGKEDIISDISFTLDRTIGIVGLSGEGKTTIIKLLLGEINPVSGECVYGGKAIGSISKYIVQTNIRYYGQDIELFDRDLNFNITLGKIGLDRQGYEEKESEIRTLVRGCIDKIRHCKGKKMNLSKEEKKFLQEVWLLDDYQAEESEVLRKIVANFAKDDAFTCNMLVEMVMSRRYYRKEKYAALVGDLGLGYLAGRKLGQRGSHVSGGEKNRIALARFLLPEFGKFFILDEPFVNLDLMMEKTCMDCLKKYCNEKIGIVISHKMNVIRDLAEQIYVIENGRITERGSHAQLQQEEGLYYQLWKEYAEQSQGK